MEQGAQGHFKDLEQAFGRADIKTFDKIIKKMMKDPRQVEDMIPVGEIEEAMKNKFYQGFSLGERVKEGIAQALRDEYGLEVEELEAIMKDRKFTSRTNQSYIRHLKSYTNELKLLKKIQA